MIESVSVETLLEQPVAVVRGAVRGDEIGGFVGEAYGEVIGTLGAWAGGAAGPPLIRYSARTTDASSEVFVLAAGFPCDGAFQGSGRVERSDLPAGPAVVAVHVGEWPELGEAYAAVAAHLAQHGLVAAGDPWETYFDGPDASPHRTTLTQPCRPAAG